MTPSPSSTSETSEPANPNATMAERDSAHREFSRRELASVLNLVSGLWLREVDAATLGHLSHPDVRSALATAGFELPEFAAPELIAREKLLEQLAIEYCRLLIGPQNHLSPVESVWSANQFQAESAGAMQRYFELLPGYEAPTGLADHIGAQLDFVAAVLLGDCDDDTALSVVNQLVAMRLGWSDRFFDAVVDRASGNPMAGDSGMSSDFYLWLARISKNVVQSLRSLPVHRMPQSETQSEIKN